MGTIGLSVRGLANWLARIFAAVGGLVAFGVWHMTKNMGAMNWARLISTQPNRANIVVATELT